MKKIKFKRVTAIASCSLLLAATTVGGIAAIPGFAADGNTYTVDLAKKFQEFDGWGLSLSWWATEIGDWTRIGSSGKEKREEIMEAIYGKSGLNLNIARYNIGGGDNPSHEHMTDDRNTPGWRSATKVTDSYEEGGETFETYELDNYAFMGENGEELPWYEMPDYRQLWVLDWIQNVRGGDDVITEFYSNSPPYWMTRTECSSGGFAPEKNSRGDVEDTARNRSLNSNLDMQMTTSAPASRSACTSDLKSADFRLPTQNARFFAPTFRALALMVSV